MTSYTFPAHYRFFARWVQQNLLGPTSYGNYELPAWRSVGWFSRVVISDEVDVQPDSDQNSAAIEYCSDMGVLTERTYIGFIAEHPVLTMSVRGIRPPDYRHSAGWDVLDIVYMVSNPSDPGETRWAQRGLMGLVFTGPGGPE